MNIWVPKTKIIEPRDPVTLASSLTGHWKLEAVNAKTGKKRFLAEFDNMILDVGLNGIGTSNGWLTACCVGTGNTAPAAGQTALVAEIARTNNVTTFSNTAQGSAPYYGSTTKTYRFAEGAAAGNIAEIGIAENINPLLGFLFSRALIVDGGGSPTTITVLSDEFLDATYQIRIKPPTSDVITTVSISGVDYDVTARASSVTGLGWAPGGGAGLGSVSGNNGIGPTAYNGAIGAVTTVPSGTNSQADSFSNASYSNNSLVRGITAGWSLSVGNLSGGIRSVNIGYGLPAVGGAGGLGAMQFEFDPPIPKTSSDVLTLNFQHSWARGTP